MSKKAIVGVALVAILSAGGYVAYEKGLIPAFSASAKTEAELKKEIEALKGDGFGKKYEAIIRKMIPTDAISGPEKAQFDAMLTQSLQGVKLNYDSMTSKSADGFAAVELTNVTVSSDGNPEIGAPKSEAIYPKVLVSKSSTDAGAYSFQIEGKPEFYSDAGGQKMKLFSATMGKNSTDFKFNPDNSLGYIKSQVSDFTLIEGRGETMLFKIADMSSEYKTASTPQLVDVTYNTSIKNIEPGDMAKMFLGGIKPVSLTVNYTYKGDDILKAASALAEQEKAVASGLAQAPANPYPSLNGVLKLSKFELKMGEAGFEAEADLNFKKDAKNGMPVGTAKVVVAKYQELVDYFSKFAPVPAEEKDKMIKYLSEVGKNENGNFTFDVSFDAEGKTTINGKSLEDVKAIETKYFPPATGMQGLEAAPVDGVAAPTATPPAVVGSAPVSSGTPATDAPLHATAPEVKAAAPVAPATAPVATPAPAVAPTPAVPAKPAN